MENASAAGAVQIGGGASVSVGGDIVGRDKIVYNISVSAASAQRSAGRAYAAAVPPPLPPNFVERPDALAALRDAVVNQKSFSIAPTALDGMGGIGKTVLAQALCRDPLIHERFRDGIAWVTIGRESTEKLETRLRRVASSARIWGRLKTNRHASTPTRA